MKSEETKYSVESRIIPVADYIRGYRDAERIGGYCRQCGNYGRLWSCPPFDFDVDAAISKWRNVLIVACRIEIPKGNNGMAELRDVRRKLERKLLDLEASVGGLAFGFSGECLHCQACSRPSGIICRHPESVRPALEAYGFDVCRTISDLFGFSLEWSADGSIPRHLTLVGALFHNADPDNESFNQIW